MRVCSLLFTTSFLLWPPENVVCEEYRGNGCSFNLREDFPAIIPVVVVNNENTWSLMQPTELNPNSPAILYLEAGQEIGLSCKGKKNEFTNFPEVEDIFASCNQNGLLKIDEESINLTDLGCKKEITAGIKQLAGRCGQNGKYMEIGFEINNEWQKVVGVCHNSELSSTLYTDHILYGTGLSGSQNNTSFRPFFQESNNYPAFSPGNLYKRQQQKNAFAEILNSEHLADRYINETNFLARGHLAPDADFLLESYRDATYFYINAAPQWQSVNGGNWLSLEKLLRQYASKNGRELDLKIITGTHGILQMPDINGEYRDMYLEISQNKLPVPKYFWKVVINPATQEGIAFVILNDPFITQNEINKNILCNDNCISEGWRTKSSDKTWKRLHKGYLYCCKIPELRSVINTIPRINNLRGILKGPK